jgi:hypothetical protein
MRQSHPSHPGDPGSPAAGFFTRSALAIALVATFAWTAPAHAQQQWLDGALTYYSGGLTSQYTGYYGAANGSLPRVGDIYYMHLVIGVVENPPSGGGYVGTYANLPAGTQFAISTLNPVYCFYTAPNGSPPRSRRRAAVRRPRRTAATARATPSIPRCSPSPGRWRSARSWRSRSRYARRRS